MSDYALKKHIKDATLVAVYRQAGRRFVPATVSARHIHLSRTDMDILFGAGYELTKIKNLAQPGQFASSDTVTIEGAKGSIEGMRVLGPVRKDTQVEISVTDAVKLGIEPAIRMSGNVDGSPGAVIVGPVGKVRIASGVIVAARHLHISDAQAEAFAVNNGDVVKLKKYGPREVVFGNFIVRSGPTHELEAHLDTDEANAAAIEDGDLLEIVE
jgi:putative phosphotransacetylase